MFNTILTDFYIFIYDIEDSWTSKLLPVLKKVVAYKKLNESTEVVGDIKRHHAEQRKTKLQAGSLVVVTSCDRGVVCLQPNSLAVFFCFFISADFTLFCGNAESPH